MHSTTVLIIYFTATLLYSTLGNAKPDGYFSPEEECNRRGGLCIHEDLCDTKEKDETACPSQRSKGAVCCHKLPSNETRCHKHGGECMLKSDCRQLTVPKATDCDTDKVCCVLSV